jgi:proteasome beta subunit
MINTTLPSGTGDFLDLLKKTGYSWGSKIENYASMDTSQFTQGTTVLAFHYKDGALIAGDRRATAGNSIMYNRCDKVIPLDDYTLMAIAGVPATAFEMGRILSHNFEYYRRSQLQSLSAEGKIRALSKLLKENVSSALSGVGAVSPILATWDVKEEKPFIYFYDILGAQFDILTHTATGSGSPVIRGILEHENLWGNKSLAEMDFKEASILAFRLLQTAALFDSATGDARPEENIYPVIAEINENGYRFMPEEELAKIYQDSVNRN